MIGMWYGRGGYCIRINTEGGSRKMWMEHSSRNLEDLAGDATGFLILQACDVTGLLLFFSRLSC